MSRPVQRRFPLSPLLGCYGAATSPQGRLRHSAAVTTISELLGVTHRTVVRWGTEGIPEDAADRAAVGLGLHPGTVWNDWYVDREAAALDLLREGVEGKPTPEWQTRVRLFLESDK